MARTQAMVEDGKSTPKGRQLAISLVATLAAFGAGIGLGRGMDGGADGEPATVPSPPVEASAESASDPASVTEAGPSRAPAERPASILDAFALDTPAGYARAYAESSDDPLARAEAALLLHYRYGPRRASLDEAKQLLAASGELAGAPAFVRRVAALAQLGEGELDAALDLLQTTDDDPRVALYRAWVELEREQPEAARAAAEQVLAAVPDERAAALVLLQTGFVDDPQAGLAPLREAATARPDHPALADALLCAERANDNAAAAEASSSEAARLRRRADLAQARGRSLQAHRLRDRARASDEAELARAPGSGFPEFDAGREQLIYGRLFVAEDPTVSAAARTHGDLIAREGLLGRVEVEATKFARSQQIDAFWLATSSLAAIADGVVRYRVVPGRSADLGLMFRSQPPPDDTDASWALMSGYELAFAGKRARLLRWDRGVAKPLGQPVAIEGLSGMTRVEVVVYAIGPQLVATVYGGQKLELLGTLSAHDTAYASGQVGVRAGVKQRGGGLELLAVMDRSRAAPSGVGQRELHGRLYLRDRDADATIFGPKRYATIPAAQLDALPRGLLLRAKAKLEQDGETRSILELNPVEAARLRRSTVRIEALEGTAPWGVLRPSYLANRDQPPTPTKRGFELGRSYKNPQMVEDLLRAYQARYPDISELVELGRTHQGRPLWALEISANPRAREDKPAVLITGTTHAGELLSTEFALDLVAGLLEGYGRVPRVTRWVDELEIWAMPMLNPDGSAAFLDGAMWANRKNGYDADGDGHVDPFEGVDLNRNFPYGWGEIGSDAHFTGSSYRGPAPGSEPETQAIMTLANAEHFAAALSFHTLGRAIFVPYLVDHSRDMRPNVAKIIAEELVAAAPEQRNGRPYVVRPNGYAVSGCDQDWLMHEHGTMALLLEGAYQNPALNIREQAVVNTRPVWETLLERVRVGPRISGHVRDEDGAPVQAQVSVVEHRLRADERWFARARDGRFDRLLAEGGRYTLRVEAPGFEPVERVVRVGGAPVNVDVVLRN